MRSNCASDRRPPSACRSPRRQSRTVPKTSKLRSAIDMASAVWHGIPVPSRMKFCPSCASPFLEMNQMILAYHVRGHGEIIVGDEIAGVKAVPPDKLRPWPLGTGQAVRDWLAARGGLGPTVA